MSTRSLRLNLLDTEGVPAAVAAAILTAVLALLGGRRIGTAGLLAPLIVALVVILLRHPLAAFGLVLTLVVVCEGSTFGIPVTPDLYKDVYKGLTPLDMLVTLAFAAVAFDIVRHRRQPRVSKPLVAPLTLVALGIISGIVVGHMHGVSIRDGVLSMHILVYLLVIPFVVFNLDLGELRLQRLIAVGVALAIFKAVAGLVVMAAGLSTDITPGTSITYYEPTANWLTMVALVGVVGAVVGGTQVPRWMLAGAPLLLASLVFSYRRSFWIALVLALLLVLLLATSARRRVTVVATLALVGCAVWAVGSLQFQAQTPLVQRFQSLSPTSIQNNAEDRYRLDERANVIAEIKHDPIAGLGMNVRWSASAQPLGVEHVDGRLYVHCALLWWWLKLGILGAAAYIALLASTGLLAWRTWRRHRQPAFRYFGLASLCTLAGLVVIETTASFTGVDARFTVLFGAQLGLLAVLADRGVNPPPERG